jgi:hypothetical protein
MNADDVIQQLHQHAKSSDLAVLVVSFAPTHRSENIYSNDPDAWEKYNRMLLAGGVRVGFITITESGDDAGIQVHAPEDYPTIERAACQGLLEFIAAGFRRTLWPA